VQAAFGFGIDRPRAVIAKPASISPLVRASQAPVALWVNISVMMPSGFSTRRISVKMAAMRCW